MNEFTKNGHAGRAAMLANMDRKTARKYLGEGKLPSEMKGERDYRTRVDPFEEVWPWVEQQLQREPELQAKTLFEELIEQHAGRFAHAATSCARLESGSWPRAGGLLCRAPGQLQEAVRRTLRAPQEERLPALRNPALW